MSTQPSPVDHVHADCVRRLEQARGDAARLEAQVAQIAAMHRREDPGGFRDSRGEFCDECDYAWPCPTSRILSDEGDA